MARKMTTARLESLRVESRGVTVSVSVKAEEHAAAPDSLEIVGRKRKSDESVTFTTTYLDILPDGQVSLVTARHDGLARGVWDLYVTLGAAGNAEDVRFGRERSAAISPEGCSNVHLDPEPQDSVIAYFTRGAGNLSVDVGGVLHRNIPRAHSVGLATDENGCALLLVEMTREPRADDEYFCLLSGIPQHGGRQLLPTVRLGRRLVGLRLPVSPRTAGATVKVYAVLEGVRVDLEIEGTAYWSARAAGYDLLSRADGGADVVESEKSIRVRDESPGPASASKKGTTSREARLGNVRALVEGIPVLGPLVVRGARAVTGRGA